MDFLIGLLALFIIATLITGLFSFFTSKPYRCSCGFEAPSKEEILAHVLVKNCHKLVE